MELADLLPILEQPTGRSTAGFPYLTRAAWVRLRDWVPHLFADGLELWALLDQAERRSEALGPAVEVTRRVVQTAVVTAPPDLWLLRHVVSALAEAGWLARLEVGLPQVPAELEPEVTLLLARGYLVRWGAGVRAAEEPTARRLFREVRPLLGRPADLSRRWTAALRGATEDLALLEAVYGRELPRAPHAAPAWVATPEDLELGYRLVPLVLGLRAADLVGDLLERPFVVPEALAPLPPSLAAAALGTLRAAGWLASGSWTPLGRRGLLKGPGPFGIIEAYWPYVERLPRIWAEGRGAVHVERAANVAASQDANRLTFERANDALDRFCAETGFASGVFVEHAVGRGEATRQRWGRSGEALAYVGADLEPAAIEAARAEQAAGRLPAAMRFVRADIGDPGALVAALREAGLSPEGAVLLVGNGFHEVRHNTDERMVEVLRGYEEAGFVLLFTEESALSVDDLLRTAWNTYHASFRYVHERSGQGLRPATPAPVPGLGPPLRASWTECAARAGYVRLERYCWRSRTVHPYPPPDGHNPSVTANHFFVPARLAARLKGAEP